MSLQSMSSLSSSSPSSPSSMSSSTPTSSSSKRKHVCNYDGCGREFSRLEHLKRHVRSHTGERPFSCIVPGCLKTFSRYDNMLQHARCHPNSSAIIKENVAATAAAAAAATSNSSSPKLYQDIVKKMKPIAKRVKKSSSTEMSPSSPSMNSSSESSSPLQTTVPVDSKTHDLMLKNSPVPSQWSSLLLPSLTSFLASATADSKQLTSLQQQQQQQQQPFDFTNTGHLDKLSAAAALLSFRNSSIVQNSEILSLRPNFI